MTATQGTAEQTEMQRLRDLLPASLRPLISLASTSSLSEGEPPIRVRRSPPWQPTATLQIDFRRWQRISQPQRDLLFLREVGWFDGRNWLQPGLYQAIVVAGGVATLAELIARHPFSMLLAVTVTGLAARQIWQNLNQETVQLDADEFALRRAQFRGYERGAAARHLLAALEETLKVDKTDIPTAMRLQRLRAIVQKEGSPSPTNP